MRVLWLVGVAALVGTASVAAQHGHEYEFDLFGAYTKYDASFGLSNVAGAGARLGYLLGDVVGVEADVLLQRQYTVASTGATMQPLDRRRQPEPEPGSWRRARHAVPAGRVLGARLRDAGPLPVHRTVACTCSPRRPAVPVPPRRAPVRRGHDLHAVDIVDLRDEGADAPRGERGSRDLRRGPEARGSSPTDAAAPAARRRRAAGRRGYESVPPAPAPQAIDTSPPPALAPPPDAASTPTTATSSTGSGTGSAARGRGANTSASSRTATSTTAPAPGGGAYRSAAPAPPPANVSRVGRVTFETERAVLTPSSAANLDQIADMLLATPSLRAEVAGYTDNIGAIGRNMRLSRQRAAAVKALYLRAQRRERGPAHRPRVRIGQSDRPKYDGDWSGAEPAGGTPPPQLAPAPVASPGRAHARLPPPSVDGALVPAARRARPLAGGDGRERPTPAPHPGPASDPCDPHAPLGARV